MKKLFITLLIIAGFIYTNGQNISFEFTATMRANVRIGKQWDFSYTDLSNPMKISLENNRLKMVHNSGKVFWEVDILNIIKTKETIENGKITEQHFALEYKEKNNYTGYILYDYKYDLGEDLYELKTPFIIDGWVFSYNYYSN
jgi:hypothetical protein